MSEVVEKLKVGIEADTSNFDKNIKKVQNSMNTCADKVNKSLSVFDKLKSKFKSIKDEGGAAGVAGALTKIVGAITAVVIAIKKIVQAINSCLKAAAQQTEAEMKLSIAMHNHQNATEEAISSVKDYAAELQGVGVVGDEVAIAGASKLAMYTKESESINKLLPAMEDLAVAQYGLNVSSTQMEAVAKLLGRAMHGNYIMLSRYGIVLSDAQQKLLKYGTEEQRVAVLSQAVSAAVGGMNTNLANTYAGRVQQLSNAFGDLKEELGYLLQYVMKPLITAITYIVKAITKVVKGIRWFFTGKTETESMAVEYQEAADSSGVIAENMSSTASSAKDTKEAVKALMGFDEINTLTAVNNAISNGGISGIGSGGSGSLNTKPITGGSNKTSGSSAINNITGTGSLWDSNGFSTTVDGLIIMDKYGKNAVDNVRSINQGINSMKAGLVYATSKSGTFNANLNNVVKAINVINGKKMTLNGTVSYSFRNYWNKIAGTFNNSSIMGALSKFVSGLPKKALKIPKLATGGITTGATTAIIGEAGREAVLPLDKNTEWMDALVNKINGSSQPINITLDIGGARFGAACINSINQANRISGAMTLKL